MNKIDKSEAFDLDALRRGQTTGDAAGSVGGERKAEISALARQIAGQYSMANYSPSIVIGQLRFLEFFSLLSIALATNFFLAEDPYAHLLDTGISGFAGALLALLFMQASDCYHVSILRSPMRSMARVIGSWMAAVGLVALFNLLFISFDGNYRIVLAAWFGVGTLYLLIERNLIGFGIRRWGRNGVMERRAVIVGGGKPAKDLIRALEQQPENDIRICGIFDDRNALALPMWSPVIRNLGTWRNSWNSPGSPISTC